jgi:hypothetical protein
MCRRDALEQLAGVKVLFIAGFGPIVRDPTRSRKLYNQFLGIDFQEEKQRSPALGKTPGRTKFLCRKPGLSLI